MNRNARSGGYDLKTTLQLMPIVIPQNSFCIPPPKWQTILSQPRLPPVPRRLCGPSPSQLPSSIVDICPSVPVHQTEPSSSLVTQRTSPGFPSIDVGDLGSPELPRVPKNQNLHCTLPTQDFFNALVDRLSHTHDNHINK